MSTTFALNSKTQKIFIVDDTRTFRAILRESIGDLSPYGELIGEASDGMEALKHPRLSESDLVLLDIYMPNMNGLEALRAIKSRYPQISVVMISDSADQNTPTTIAALTQGALDFIHKDPNPKETRMNRSYLKGELLRILQILKGGFPQTEEQAVWTPPPLIKRQKAFSPLTFSLIAMGVSTGGPKALNFLLPKLTPDLGCPILLVQHMPEKFTKSLAESLNQQCILQVKEAMDGEELTPNTIYIAQGGRHMEITRFLEGAHRIKITDTPPVLSCRPSVDILFKSIAHHWKKNNVLAIILTGMGYDGLEGVRELKMKGCYCISQDKATSTVYGMPKAIAENNLADEILPLSLIPTRMAKLVRNPISHHVNRQNA